MEKILVVDDMKSAANLIRDALSAFGFDVTAFNDPVLALEFAKNESEKITTFIVITDYSMPAFNGVELIRGIKLYHSDVHGLLYTNSITKDEVTEYPVLEKSVDNLPHVVKFIESVLKKRNKTL